MGSVDADNVDVDQALVARVAAADLGEAAPRPGPVPPGVPANDQAPPPPDESLLWIHAAQRYGAMVRTMLPDQAAAHWTDERLQNLGRELANCARHYNWQFGAKLTHPLALLAAAGWPLAWPIAAPYVMPYIVNLLKGAQPEPKPAEEKKPAPAAAAPRPFPDLSEPPPPPKPAA